jgi:hypothetical protein
MFSEYWVPQLIWIFLTTGHLLAQCGLFHEYSGHADSVEWHFTKCLITTGLPLQILCILVNIWLTFNNSCENDDDWITKNEYDQHHILTSFMELEVSWFFIVIFLWIFFLWDLWVIKCLDSYFYILFFSSSFAFYICSNSPWNSPSFYIFPTASLYFCRHVNHSYFKVLVRQFVYKDCLWVHLCCLF